MSVSSVGLASNQYQWPTFNSTDTDGDGELSLGEFSAVGQNVQGGSNGLDSDSIQQIFSAIDTDGDGKISRSEATSAFDKLSSAVQSGLLGAQEQFGGPPPPPPSGGDFFASADTDGSGGLSFDEFKTAAASNAPPGASAPSDDQLKAIFDKLDTNGDGQVSQDELKAAHKGHHHHHTPPAQSSDSSSDPSSTADASLSDPTSATNTDNSTTASTSSLSDLFLQAVSAYSGTSQASAQNSSADIVNQILDTLKAV
jgi:Ca2+-binding EF-hand superfamily protein